MNLKAVQRKKVLRKKKKLYKSKEEEQERISLEKANAQKHKKEHMLKKLLKK